MVVFCFRHATNAVLGEETAGGVGLIGRGEVDVEAHGWEFLLIGGEDDAGVLKYGGRDGKKRALKMGWAGGGEEKF